MSAAIEPSVPNKSYLRNYVIKAEQPGDAQIAISIIDQLELRDNAHTRGNAIALSLPTEPKGKLEIFKEGFGQVYKHTGPVRQTRARAM